ncbi:MAG: DUF2809 domain-containing protein [Mucilaginibacter polytrichastri]|nr:DUF2809 domain-containing protein [Mucilaginibacter polytrichastri]
MRFHPTYFFWTAGLFGTECLIARYAHDDIVRPYVGDVLVVILLYCFVRAFFRTAFFTTVFSVLLFACFIEWLQYINFITWIGLEKSAAANLLLGNYFTWVDIWCYVLGIVLIIGVEKCRVKKAQPAL